MKTTLAVATGAVAIAIAGCGGSSDNSSSSASTQSAPTTPAATSSPSSGSGKSTQLKLAADPSGALKFDKTSLSAKAGKVTIVMDNAASVPHGVGIQGNGVDTDGQVVNKGGKSMASADLKPGTYTFYCPVPGHRQAGMEGKLTVK